jgi:hypothetical protein
VPDQQANPNSNPNPTPGPAVALVESVRRRARSAVLSAAWIRAAALVLAVLLVFVALDYVFRLPRAVRAVNLALCVWGLVELWRRMVLPAVRFRPSPAEVAMRIERAAGTGDRLASGVQFAGVQPAGPGDNPLAAALARATADEADRAAVEIAARRFVQRRGVARAAGMFTIVAALAAGSAGVRPDLAATGVARALWPLGDARWPTRTAVLDATDVAVQPVGEAMPLRAVLTRTHLPMGRTDVAAAYRVIIADEAGPTERVVLTSQHRLAQAVSGDSDGTGELFERLIEPIAEIREGQTAEIEYWFETEDNRTEPRRIALAARPAVTEIAVTVDPPGYARELRGSFLHAAAMPVTPDPSGVASVQPILSGSLVRIAVALSKPAHRVGDDAGWSDDGPRTLIFETTATERTRIDITLVDDDGLEGVAPVAVVLDVVPDSPAGVSVVEPANDESVLATAVVDLRAEGRDDFGMRWLALERQTARPPAGSEGGAPEPADPVEVGRVDAPAGALPPELTLAGAIDLATMGVRPGDEVWVSALGRDVFAEATGDHDDRAARSPVRRLRIIDETAFINQIRGELAGVRRAAIEIDREQADLQSRLTDPALELTDDELRAIADRQGAVTERLDAQRGALERLGHRADRNALDDETLTGMLADAETSLREATKASASAAGDAADAAEPEREPEPRMAEDQQRVREELESLIAMLDQGQDNWVARRTIESLLQDQKALAAETAALGERTMGQSPEQLSTEDRTELERIASRQREAAERAQQAMDSLTDRAESLERVDSAQAQAMSQAARRGRQERLDEQMQQAAAQVRQNQTRAAAQGQQAAVEALEQMLEDIDSAEATRDQALRRVLATVLESLEALIGDQERQIDSLARARVEEELVPLAEPMVALAANTLGLLDEISAQRDLASVAAPVGLAADAQERAVGSLRDASADSAAEAEDESLTQLREARDEAKRLDEEAGGREGARKRAELRGAYRELLEQQAAIADDTLPWVGAEVDRRARAQVRALGQRQQGFTESLAELRRATAELADAAVFDLAHRRLDRASESAAAVLLDGRANTETARQQATIVRLLRSLVESMGEQNQDQRFGEGQSGAGGGSGASGGDQPMIPDLAELKLLRAMQAEAMEWTRNLDESAQRPGEAEVAELADLQKELALRAEALIEKLTQQAPQGGGGAR